MIIFERIRFQMIFQTLIPLESLTWNAVVVFQIDQTVSWRYFERHFHLIHFLMKLIHLILILIDISVHIEIVGHVIFLVRWFLKRKFFIPVSVVYIIFPYEPPFPRNNVNYIFLKQLFFLFFSSSFVFLSHYFIIFIINLFTFFILFFHRNILIFSRILELLQKNYKLLFALFTCIK